MARESLPLIPKLTLDGLKTDVWELANITNDNAGFIKAETILNKYSAVFDQNFPEPEQREFTAEIKKQLELYKEESPLDNQLYKGTTHKLISTIIQQYSSIKRNNLDIFGHKGRVIADQATMDTRFTHILGEMHPEQGLTGGQKFLLGLKRVARFLGKFIGLDLFSSTDHKWNIQNTATQMAHILSTAKFPDKGPAKKEESPEISAPVLAQAAALGTQAKREPIMTTKTSTPPTDIGRGA